MADEEKIDYKEKYDREFTKRLDIPMTEIENILINPVDPTYFYVIKKQTIQDEVEIKNYVAAEDKFRDYMEEVEDLEYELEDDELGKEYGPDTIEKTLAYMRDNKIYSVDREGKAKENLETGIQDANTDKARQFLNKLSKMGSKRTDLGVASQGSNLGGLTSKNTVKRHGNPTNAGLSSAARRPLAGIKEDSGEGATYTENEEDDSAEGEDSSAEGLDSEGEDSEESSEEEASSSLQHDGGQEESSAEVEDEDEEEESEEDDTPEDETPEEDTPEETYEDADLEEEDSEESSEEEGLEGSEPDRPSEARIIHRDDTDNAKASPGFVVPPAVVKINDATRNPVENEMAGVKEGTKVVNAPPRDEEEEEKNEPPVPAAPALVQNPEENKGNKPDQLTGIKKPEENKEEEEENDEPEIETEKNATESYKFEHIEDENSGYVLKKYRKVLLCCSFQQYGYSIVQKLYADKYGNDLDGDFKFNERMAFSACGQYFSTSNNDQYIIYNAKSLKPVANFQLDRFYEDTNDYSTIHLSSDAKYLARSSYEATYIYQAFSQEPGAQVNRYQNYEVSLRGFMNSNYLIGVKNTNEESFICKINVANEELKEEKINGSYFDQEITKHISDINFNPKGKACAFVVDYNTLYYLDLTRRNSTPQKVLENFERIIYDVDSDRISTCYVEDGQSYIALYKKNTLMYRKKYEKNFYDLFSIDSDDNNEVIYIESNGYYKTIHTIDDNNAGTIKFEPKMRFHYPLIFYEYEKNELWFQSIEEKNVIHRFLFVNTLSAVNCIDVVNTGFCSKNYPTHNIKLLLSYEADHKIASMFIQKEDGDEEEKLTLEADVERFTKSIKFTELPNADILSFVQMSGVNERGLQETCFLFHFPSQMKLYFLKSGKIKKTFDRSYKRRNIISFLDRTFFWEDKGRSIERMESLIPKDEKHYFYKVYDAKNVIKMCKKIDYIEDKECLQIIDEEKYVKILVYDEGNKKFEIAKEYYIEEYFDQGYISMDQFDTYYLSNGMLYTNSRTFLLQERGHEKKEHVVQLNEPTALNFNTLQFPLVSNSHIIKLTQGGEYMGKNEVYICAPYNSNKVPNVPGYDLGLEWFSPDDKEKVIRVMASGYLSLKVTLNTPNGVLIDQQGVHVKDYDPIVVPSQDGRYILVYNNGDDVNHETDESPSIEWTVYEIRIKSATQSAESKKDENEEMKAELHNLVSEETKEGSESKKKQVLDVRMVSEGTIETKIKGHLKDEIKVAVLNNGNFIAFHLESCTFRYNNEDVYKKIKSNIESNSKGLERNKELDGYKIQDIKVGQDYVILKFPKALFSFRFREDPAKGNFIYHFKKMKVPIITDYQGVSLNDIIVTSHPTKVLLNYTFEEGKGNEKNNILTWDIDKDEEISSFTSRDDDTFLFYMYCPLEEVKESIAHHASMGGYSADKKLKKKLLKEKKEKEKKEKEDRKKVYEIGKEENPENSKEDEKKDEEDEDEDRYRVSQTGYLVFDEYYVNLDTMIPSPFMKFDGEQLERNQYQYGPKMNHDESLAMVNGTAISAYSYLDIEFRMNRNNYGENPLICKYFVNGKSIVSDYILEDDKLERALKVLEKDPIYLSMILIPDYKNKTPLDEAIANNSPKVVEMLLGSILKLDDFKLSNSFKHQFFELFDMGVESFRQYLNLCYFTTGQMKFMKKTSYDKAEDIQRLPSSSSILDNKFNSKFMKEKKKRSEEEIKLEAETMKKDQNDGDKLIEKATEKKDKKEAAKEDENLDSEDLESDISLFEMGIEDNDDYNEMFKKEIRIEVKAIEFDWILKSKEGEAFLENLRHTSNLDYFQIDLVKDIIFFQWQYFLPRII